MANEAKVTRIKATDDTPKREKTSTKKEAPVKKAVSKEPKGDKANVFVRIGRYFKGAWQELKEVRWPSRKATWSLTLAVILFSAFFGTLIVGLDALFNFIFKLIIV